MKSTFFNTVFLLLLGATFGSCSNNSNSKNQTKEIATGEISVNDFEQKINATTNAQIVDVRTPEEYEEGHLLSAQNIDWNGTDFDLKIGSLNKTSPTFVYCLSGGRSKEAASQMSKLGFTEIYQMQGGLRAWKKAGKTEVTQHKTAEITGMKMADYTEKVFSDKMVLVDFNAPWCGPCKIMAPVLEELASEQKDNLELLKINYDNNKILADELKVENLPTLLLYRDGKEVWRNEGALDKIALMVAIDSHRK